MVFFAYFGRFVLKNHEETVKHTTSGRNKTAAGTGNGPAAVFIFKSAATDQLVSFLYLIRCGVSSPRRFFRFSSYSV